MQTIRNNSPLRKFDGWVASVRRGLILIALALAALAGALTPITAHAQVNLYVSVNGPLGSDDGSISEYTPAGVQTTFASGIPQPRGLAFDSMGNLYAAITALVDNHAVGKVVEFNPRGKATATGFGQGFGLAFDNAGNLYAADAGDQTIYKFTPDGTRTVFAGPSAFATSTG